MNEEEVTSRLKDIDQKKYIKNIDYKNYVDTLECIQERLNTIKTYKKRIEYNNAAIEDITCQIEVDSKIALFLNGEL